MGAVPRYTVIEVPWSVMADYWERQPARALKARFPEVEIGQTINPKDVYNSPYCLNYAVIHLKTRTVAGEFTLMHKSYKSIQIHFSIDKDFYRHSLEVSRDAVREVFNWKDRDGSEYVHTLVGVTPVTNTLAINFKEKLGFKVIGQVPGMFVSGAGEISILEQKTWDPEQVLGYQE